MDAQEMLLSSGRHIEFWRQPSGKVGVRYKDCEVKDGQLLHGIFGEGDTLPDACKDYMKEICGKTLVFYADTDMREEIKCFP